MSIISSDDLMHTIDTTKEMLTRGRVHLWFHPNFLMILRYTFWCNLKKTLPVVQNIQCRLQLPLNKFLDNHRPQ